MRYSQLFSKTRKSVKEYNSINATLLEKAGFIQPVMSGVYILLPLGWKVIIKIESIIRKELNKMGAQEIFMPALHPRWNWEKTDRWNTLDILFKLKGAGDKDFALGPTHEEIITPLAKKHIFSYKDLPIALYQIQNKFRNEFRAKSGLLRGREFLMKDMYSFHQDKKCLDGFYKKVKEIYAKIFDEAGIGKLTHLTYASGGSFSKYSHEYQTISESGEDTIYLCSECGIAINEEIYEKEECPECGNKKLAPKKSIEIGNIFKLRNKFSKAFELVYIDKNGKEKYVEMGCYGIGIQRLMGAVVETLHDKKGIIWPVSISPLHVYLLSIGEENVKSETEKIYQKLNKAKIEVLFDDRNDVSEGEKFADADLLGFPFRIVVSNKTLKKGGVEIKERKSDEIFILSTEKALNFLSKNCF